MNLLRPALWFVLCVALLLNSAGPSSAGPVQRVEEAVCQRLFRAVQGLAERIAARASRVRDLELALTRCEMDKRHRIYVDYDGDVDLKLPALSDRTRAWLAALPGAHELTDGPVIVDYTVTEADFPAERTVHLAFTFRAIIVVEGVLSKLLEAAISLTETVTAVALSGDLAALLERVDPIAAGDGLDAGIHDLGRVLVGLGAVEAYDTYRRRDDDRSTLGDETAGRIVRHLIVAVLEAVTHVTAKIAGASFGAAVGAALLPVHGAVLGAIVGSAALGMIGKALYEHVTVNWGTRLAMKRIARLVKRRAQATDPVDQANLDQKQEEQELSFLRHVLSSLRNDTFHHLDEFIEQLHGLSTEAKAPFASLEARIEERLRYEVLYHHDELFARKLAELKSTFKGH